MLENTLKLLPCKVQNELISWSILNDGNIHHFDWSDTYGQEVGLLGPHPYYYHLKIKNYVFNLTRWETVFSRFFFKSHSLAFLSEFDFSLSFDDFSFLWLIETMLSPFSIQANKTYALSFWWKKKEDNLGPKNSRCFTKF